MAQPASDTGQQHNDAPEVVKGSGPEVAYDRADIVEIRNAYRRAEHTQWQAQTLVETEEDTGHLGRLTALVVIALVVGLVVGLERASQTTPEADDAGVDPASLCNGAVCPQGVATAAFRDELHIFIRSSNGNIQHRSVNGFSFDYSSWKDLFKTATLT